MQRIVVKNFGPLKDIDLEIKDFMVFIGPNASGKSTLAKLIYFFLNVPENLAKAHLDSFGLSDDELRQKLSNSYLKYFNYGLPPSFLENTYIKFEYSEEINITFDRTIGSHSFPFSIVYSSKFESILNYINKLKDFFESKDFGDIDKNYIENKYQFFNEIKSVINLEFSRIIDLRKYYFPEGRSSFNYNSDTLKDYEKSFSDLIKESQFFLNDIFSRGFGKKDLVEIIGGKIIKLEDGRYGLELKDGQRVIFQLLSSGQKEVFWFLVSLFQIFKKDEPNYLFIEEPETHLFPDKQKNLLYYLVSLYKKSHSQLLITTHSHYIIGVINVLINAHRIGQLHPEKVEKVISKEYWLDKERVFVGRLIDGKLENVYSEEAEMFDHEELTQTSGLLNSEMDELYEIEFESENDKD